MTDVPSSALRIWAKAVDELMVGFCLIPAFGYAAFRLFGDEPLWISWPLVVYLLMVPLLYEGLSLWLFGTTFGKWLFFLKVVNAKVPESPLEAWQTFTRALAGRMTFFFSYAVQALALFRYDRTHLADWLGGTRVVTTRPRPRQVKIHWIIGTLCVVFFALSGLGVSALFLNSIQLEWSGLYFSPFAIQ